jgi:uncharacterized membrane protein YhfC
MISFALFLTLLISGLLAIFIPILLGLWIWSKLKARWLAFLVGAVLWFVAYVVRTPINTSGALWFYQNFKGAALIYLSIAFPSLTAGIFEESARWLAFRFAVKDHRLENGLMYGAGHGGLESILLAGVSLLGSALVGYFYPQTLTTAQLTSLTLTPEWLPFISLWERLAAITFHVAMSVLVLQSFRQKQTWYLGVAIGAHFFLNFAAIYALQWGIIASELVTTAFAAVSLWYLWTTWKSYKTASVPSVAPAPENPPALNPV